MKHVKTHSIFIGILILRPVIAVSRMTECAYPKLPVILFSKHPGIAIPAKVCTLFQQYVIPIEKNAAALSDGVRYMPLLAKYILL